MPKTFDGDWLDPQSRAWMERLGEFLARGRIADAFRFLDRISRDQQMSLFEGKPVVDSQRHLAWLFKINLLRGLGRSREAFAWTCMECELAPDNVAAQALKEELKRRLGFTPPGKGIPPPDSHPPGDVWKGVAGMRELKAILERDVILPLAQPELYRRYRISLPNGILLYGPPGCGKTHIAQKLGGVLGFHFLSVKPSDLGSIYVHGTQGRIADLFKTAREKAPTMLFFDELDALIPARGDNVGHHYSAEVNEFLTQLNKAAESRILVVGATNRLDKIDAAAMRPGRFDKKVFVGQPDLEARVELLRLYVADRPQEPLDWLPLGRESTGYTCAELEHVVNEAARRALDRRGNIGANDILAALAANAPAHAGERPEPDDR